TDVSEKPKDNVENTKTNDRITKIFLKKTTSFQNNFLCNKYHFMVLYYNMCLTSRRFPAQGYVKITDFLVFPHKRK
ncbi:hypothetical protein, partial [Geobacillus proteiniphilus]|uniref:hypothetical protein n=1 Tax=Geobacillus proteiniphilus TaxID=860353 RepID=UPI00195D67BC